MVAEHVGRWLLQTRFTVTPIKSLPRKTARAQCAAHLWQAWGPLIFRPPPPNAARTQSPSQHCSQTLFTDRLVPALSLGAQCADLGIWASTERSPPGPQGPRDSVSASRGRNKWFPARQLTPEDVPPPSSEARVRTHGVEGSPPGSGGRDPSCLSGSGDPGLMSASPASSLWPLSLWVCVFCPRLDPRPPLYKDRRRQSGPQDHLSSRGPSLSHICRDPFPVRSQSRALGQGAAPHVQEPPASRVWTGH